MQFVGRFLQHVLPAGFKRIRHHGLLAPARKAHALARARQALQVPPPQPTIIESVAQFLRRIERAHWLLCPSCPGALVLVQAIIPQRPGRVARAPP